MTICRIPQNWYQNVPQGVELSQELGDLHRDQLMVEHVEGHKWQLDVTVLLGSGKPGG